MLCNTYATPAAKNAYAAYIDAYRKETRHIRPIWGIDRNDREAHLALYRKGSVLLADLLVRVGEEPFFNFLAGVIQAHITDTSASWILRKADWDVKTGTGLKSG